MVVPPRTGRPAVHERLHRAFSHDPERVGEGPALGTGGADRQVDRFCGLSGDGGLVGLGDIGRSGGDRGGDLVTGDRGVGQMGLLQIVGDPGCLLGSHLLGEGDVVVVGVDPAIASPTAVSLIVSCVNSEMIRPRCMTRSGRSDRLMTSLRSAETRRTPAPRSRAATRTLWTNSIAPTSTPRVGCDTTKDGRVGLELTSDDDLLHVATRQRADLSGGNGATNVELPDQRIRRSGEGAFALIEALRDRRDEVRGAEVLGH